MSEFSEWLTQEVGRRGLSLRDLADEITRRRQTKGGVKHTTIKSWMDDYAVPTWHNAGTLAEALGVPRAYVRGLAGYNDPEDEPYDGDIEASELLAIWGSLDEFDRQVLIRSARALRDSPSRRA